MSLFWMFLLAALLLAAAIYAQSRIPRFTASRRNVRFARLVLAAVGLGCAIVSARLYAADTLTAVLAFIAGFGVVHVPAAFILLIKRGRGAGRT